MAKKNKNGKAGVTPQTQIRRLKKEIKHLKWENEELLKVVHQWYKERFSIEECEAWVKNEVEPLLNDPKALEAALSGPTILDVIKEFKREQRQKRLTRKGA